MQYREVSTWPDESEDGSLPDAREFRSRRAGSSQRTPSLTHGWQMAFPLPNLPTAESWCGERTARSRRFEGLDPLFWEGILE